MATASSENMHDKSFEDPLSRDELRKHIVSVISETANGTLGELGYFPGFKKQMAELVNTCQQLQAENLRLFNENCKLQNSNQKMFGDNRKISQLYYDEKARREDIVRRQEERIHRHVTEKEEKIRKLAQDNIELSRRVEFIMNKASPEEKYQTLLRDFHRLQERNKGLSYHIKVLESQLAGASQNANAKSGTPQRPVLGHARPNTEAPVVQTHRVVSLPAHFVQIQETTPATIKKIPLPNTQIQPVQNVGMSVSQSLPNVTNQFHPHLDPRHIAHIHQFTPSPVAAGSPGATLRNSPDKTAHQLVNVGSPVTPVSQLRFFHDRPRTESPLAMQARNEVIDLTEDQTEDGSVDRLMGTGALKRKAGDDDPLPKRIRVDEPQAEMPQAAPSESPVPNITTPEAEMLHTPALDHEQVKDEALEEEEEEESIGEKVVSAVFEDDRSDESKQWCQFCRIRFEKGRITDPVQPFINASVDELLKHVQDDHPPSYAKLVAQLSES